MSNLDGGELVMGLHLKQDRSVSVGVASGNHILNRSGSRGEVLVDGVDVVVLVKGPGVPLMVVIVLNRSVEILDWLGLGLLRSRLGLGRWLRCRLGLRFLRLGLGFGLGFLVLEDSLGSVLVSRTGNDILDISVEVAGHIGEVLDLHALGNLFEVVVLGVDPHDVELIGVLHPVEEVLLLVIREEASDGLKELLVVVRKVQTVGVLVLRVLLSEGNDVLGTAGTSDVGTGQGDQGNGENKGLGLHT